jgi:hypothetical protein
VSASDTAARRLLDLERILAQSRTQPAATVQDADPVKLHLADVPIERIRRFTAELQSADAERDEVAAITMRLLLNDYAAAVSHLRAVARISVARIDSAVDPIRDCQKFLRREDKLAMKRAANGRDGAAES